MDSTDTQGIEDCKRAMWNILNEGVLKVNSVLIMANKQDLPNALTPEEVGEKMEIESVTDKKIGKD